MVKLLGQKKVMKLFEPEFVQFFKFSEAFRDYDD